LPGASLPKSSAPGFLVRPALERFAVTDPEHAPVTIESL
jgi:hypothetical protein